MAAALVGKEAPDFKITLIDGSETSLKALLALGKSVVIDFYTSWCANACSALGKPPTKQPRQNRTHEKTVSVVAGVTVLARIMMRTIKVYRSRGYLPVNREPRVQSLGPKALGPAREPRTGRCA